MRASGILMPVSSLASNYGIGTIGKAAYEFVDFLKQSGQKYWQILPLGPTGYGDSPYQSFSAFAANPYFIDLDLLKKENLLTQKEIDSFDYIDKNNKHTIDYAQIYKVRFKVLNIATNRIDKTAKEYTSFVQQNKHWVEDYALFMAIKESQNMVGLVDWQPDLRTREQSAIEKAKIDFADRIDFYIGIQFLFYSQWEKLKKYANKNGIKIIGDIPIYISPDSSDLWANKELFDVDENGNMVEVAGCPPDSFSKDGQLWGNPLYNWDYHLKTNCEWWVNRLNHSTKLYDIIRIDHFRGFESYYTIKATEKTARKGKWKKGPDKKFIDLIKKGCNNINIIAEDLGFLTQDVYDLLEYSGYPGMKVLQFAFDSREESDYLPHNYHHNSIVYTGTHDNPTTQDWVKTAPKADVKFAYEYFNLSRKQSLCDHLVREALASICDTAIIPMQDWLQLGKHARINTPSTIGGNWEWRIKPNALTNNLAKHIKAYTKMYGRLPKQKK